MREWVISVIWQGFCDILGCFTKKRAMRLLGHSHWGVLRQWNQRHRDIYCWRVVSGSFWSCQWLNINPLMAAGGLLQLLQRQRQHANMSSWVIRATSSCSHNHTGFYFNEEKKRKKITFHNKNCIKQNSQVAARHSTYKFIHTKTWIGTYSTNLCVHYAFT